MTAENVLLVVMAVAVAAVGLLMITLGGAVRRERRATNLALPNRDRIRDVAGASRWVGAQMRLCGYGTLVVAALLAAIVVFDAGRYVPALFAGWGAALILWTLVLLAGARRYYRSRG